MNVYVFGNEDVNEDKLAMEVAKKLVVDFGGQIKFEFVKPNADLPFENSEDVVILDVIAGLDFSKVLSDMELNHLSLSPRNSAHDFDLGLQLKYLKKLGRLGKVTIVGLPMSPEVDYSSVHSIFKKLVAQDMHGS
ncbi:MAG: hypothetical protein NT141_04405 [candidate division WWE3 bacterium]|nr:hypothetical protein [candidate division WWE3 bacterium]